MTYFWSNCFAQVRFSALGGYGEKLLTLCLQQGIPVARVKPVPGGFTASVPARYYKTVFKFAKRCRTRLRVIQKRGIYFRTKHYRGRWGLLIGPLVLLCAVHMFGKAVWAIRWDGATPLQQHEIGSLLYSMDIYEGAILNQEKIRLAEKHLLDQSNELGWVALNFEKGRLVVEMVAAREKPQIESNDTVSLVAAADGIILEANVQEGFLQKQVGQTVAKGEVLISSVLADRKGRNIYVHAKGTVIAEIKKQYKCRQPLSLSAQALTGEVTSQYTLRVGSLRLPLGPTKQLDEEKSKLRHEPLNVFGFALPATLEESYSAQLQQRDTTLSEQQALVYARYSCIQQMYSEFPGATVLTQSEQYDMDTETGELVYAVTLQIKANIAKLANE